MMSEQLNIHMQKNYVENRPYAFRIVNSKYIIELKVKFKITKLLEDNLGEKLR